MQVPWQQQHCRQGAGKEARGWLCPPSKEGSVCKRGGPEVRILGWGGGLPNRFKEETSSFTALFRGSRECLSGFKYQQLSLGVLAGVTSRGWDGRTAAH